MSPVAMIIDSHKKEARRPVVRAVALDVLRGLAVLMMVFSGVIPFDQPLPRWIFHAQEPPVAEAGQVVHHFDPYLPGLTWVDLVFPLFLFALGAAIPSALARRMDQGLSLGRAGGMAARRLLLLGWFAIFLQHVRPYTLSARPDTGTWLTALLGFVLLFLMFTRLPPGWGRGRFWAMRGVGYGGAVALLAWLSVRQYPDGGGFRLDRSDIILIVLADTACFGTGLWLLTRRHLLGRLGALALLLACHLASGLPGWVHQFWNYSPVPWLFQWDYLKYLFIVVPGTIAGDLLLDRQHDEAADAKQGSRTAPSRRRLAAFAVLTVIVTAATLAGLEGRWTGLSMPLGDWSMPSPGGDCTGSSSGWSWNRSKAVFTKTPPR